MRGRLAPTTAAPVTVEAVLELPDREAWDRVVDVARAPVFYRSWFVAAYDERPLQPTLDRRYLVARGPSGAVLAVLPLYLVPPRDPLAQAGVEGRGTWAITHFWHCNDTRLPALRSTPELVRRLVEAIEAQAEEWGAATFGFVNVVGSGELSERLAQQGRLACRPTRPRYRISLEGVRSLADHLGRLRPRVRQDFRRQLRKAARDGAETKVLAPPFPPALVERVCELLEGTEPRYYRPEPLAHLLSRRGTSIRLPVITIGSEVVAASYSFLDPPTLNNWAIGVDPSLRSRFSPYAVLLARSIDFALATGCSAIELGRTNGDWKQRVGASAIDLVWWTGEA